MAKVVVLEPAGTVTVVGTVASGELLESGTETPLVGADAVSVSVAVELEPPTNELGLNAIDFGAMLSTDSAAFTDVPFAEAVMVALALAEVGAV
jgi:hypothetical protein